MNAGAGTPPSENDLSPYRLIQKLGDGGLGTVYLVEDTQRGRRAVMKVGRPGLDASAQDRLRAEAAVLTQFRHPHIPPLYDFGTLRDGRPFLLTEWLEGSDLAALRDASVPLTVRDILLIIRSVASALAYAHQRQVLHLDVKPANIFIPKREERFQFHESKLIDFSVRGVLEAATGMTRAGLIVGTPYYMAPEQVRGEALTPAADVFSLGVVLYELLTGRRPFEAAQAHEMFLALLSKEPAPLDAAIPQSIAKVVQQCLQKDPQERPASGTEVLALIEPLLAQRAEYDDWVAPPASFSPSASTTQHSGLVFKSVRETRNISSSASVRLGPASSAQSSTRSYLMLAVWIGMVSMVGLALVLVLRGVRSEWLFVVLGGFLIVAGSGLGAVIRRYLARRRHQLTGDISALLGSAQSRKALSMTLSLQMDEVIKKCRLMDEKFLGLTMAMMVKEYHSARKFDDRQKALMNAVAILDKLGPKLSPWYLRHEKLIAAAVSLAGILSGLATAALNITKLVKGTP